jgi:hypothetical protein
MKKKYLIDDFEARSVALIADSVLVRRAPRAAASAAIKPKASVTPRLMAPLFLGYAAARAGLATPRRELSAAF